MNETHDKKYVSFLFQKMPEKPISGLSGISH